MSKFTHLHVHSHYSLLDGLPKIDELVNYAKESGMNSLALTDHGVLYGAVEFFKACKAKGIKPIIGCEMYTSFERMDQKRPNIDDKRYHLILLVKNEEGYKNLVQLITKAHLEGFYYKPRIDDELLAKYSAGLIGLSACLQGKIPRLILASRLEDAKKQALKYQEIFGKGNFYLELQHHPHIPEQEKVNKILISFSKELGIPLVATNDSHYLKPGDAEVQDILMLINTGADLNDPERLTMKGEDFSFKKPEEMIESFKNAPEAIENTQKIAEACNFQFELGKTKLPRFQVPDNKAPEQYLEELCYKGLPVRYGENPDQKVIERLKYELSVIQKTGFAGYFLIVQDFVNWAKSNRIVVGPGRGCLLPSTTILMADGTQKSIQEIKINDLVISGNGKSQKVTNLFSYDVDEKIAIIEAKMPTKNLSLTSDHKVLATRHKMCPVMKGGKKTICKPTCRRSCKNKLWKDYKLEWIESKNLKKNDFLIYPITPIYHYHKINFDLLKFDKRLKGSNKYVWYEIGTNKLILKKVKRYIKLDNKLARLLGFYISEGWVCLEKKFKGRNISHGTIGFGFHQKEKEYIKEVRNLLKEIFGLDGHLKLHKQRKSYQITAHSRVVAKFFKKLCGKGASNKHIPSQIIKQPNRIIVSLLTTLFKGDGSNKDVMRISFDSVSYNLISQVKLLLAKLGVMSSIKYRRHKERNWNTSYKLRFSGEQLFKYNQIFKDFKAQIKKQKFYRNDTFSQRNCIFFPVKNIKFKNYKGKVYDFTVKNDVSYIANEITVHNSVGGSLVSYLLNITNVDPLKNNLLFERFLNPERISMPDIDLDFTDRRRNEVINYIAQKYGKDHVAQIITFGTMASRAVIRDVGRALAIPYSYCDKIAKMIPFGFTLEETLKKVSEFREIYESDDQAKKLIDLAKNLEGVARHASTHACGVVISAEPLSDYVPLQHPTQDDESIVTQYEMHAIEDLGLLKMDLLGLKNLTIIEDCLARIYEVHKQSINIDNIPSDDEKTYKLFQEANTTGVFQMESDGFKRYLKELKPTVFEDLVAMVALYRPGPIQFIPDFIKGKHKKKKIEYLHPKLKPILETTYGICVFQEQLMQIAQQLAGFSLSEADVLRKAVGKKIKELLRAQEEKFISGCIKNSIDKKIAQELWQWILPFAEYGFNKSHSVAYATIAYQTAYLKARYPVEFMAALLTSEKADVERIAVLIKECKKMGIVVLPPDVNESFRNFSVVPNENKIRFGLLAIKNVGENVVEAIISERKKGGHFKSIHDFISRIQSKTLNKKSLESLIKAGVFDRLEERNKLLHNLEDILEANREIKQNLGNGQKNLLENCSNFNHSVIRLKQAETISLSDQLNWEKELLGLYVSAHPLDNFKTIFEKRAFPINNITSGIVGKTIRVGGIISGIKRIITRSGKPMLFMGLEDLTNKIEVVVFPSIIDRNPTVFQENKIVFVKGRVDNRDNVPKIICEEIEEVIEN